MKPFFSLFLRTRNKRREELAMVRRVTHDARMYKRIHVRPALWDGLIFLTLALGLSVIAFFGRPPHSASLRLKQTPKFSFLAPFSFTYDSALILENRRQAARAEIMPVFRINTTALADRIRSYREFAAALVQSRDSLIILTPDEATNRVAEMPEAQRIPGVARMVARSAAFAVRRAQSPEAFTRLFEDTLTYFEELNRRGIWDEETLKNIDGNQVVRLVRQSDHRDMTVVEARQTLFTQIHLQLAAEAGSGREEMANSRYLARALAETVQDGLAANIRFDTEETSLAREKAAAAVLPVSVRVNAGDPLISREVQVDAESLERWKAYRTELMNTRASLLGITRDFWENACWGVAIIALVAAYSRVAPGGRSPRRKRAMTLTAIAVALNLFLLRLTLGLSESFPSHSEPAQWMAPWGFAALVAMVLVGPHMAMVAALIVSGFATVMNGNDIGVTLASLASSLLAIQAARGVRLRARIIGAGVISALPAALVGTAGHLASDPTSADLSTALTIAGAALGGGLITGILAVLLLPQLENTFKTTTDITLLELTDYNHPLLRKLQILAPGTFHHSVMVANIAENAAREIGANALYCRCASLFHDIGKMAKPEYFIENQRPGSSPHTDIAPSMSALVIKSHVREGVEIAREYRLPRMLIDIIEQHHGTGLIGYFYHKACKAVESDLCSRTPGAIDPAITADAVDRGVDQALYRYDGPKPKTREAAIILLSDSVEAASRSLKKVSPQSVEDLVETILRERVADGQLDESSLTFGEMRRVRDSLKKSLITALHHRVEYPADSPRPARRRAHEAGAER